MRRDAIGAKERERGDSRLITAILIGSIDHEKGHYRERVDGFTVDPFTFQRIRGGPKRPKTRATTAAD